MSTHASLWLASASPRRRAILASLGVAFQVHPADVDERLGEGEAAMDYARRLAHEKAHAVWPGETAAVASLGADTIVVCQGEVMGKPRDDADALRMLTKLARGWHQVTTAICVVGASGSARAQEVTSEVRFRPLPEDALRRYVATGEGRDKAGSYAIQGLGAGLVSELRGSYSNVVGLPAAETLELLERAGCLERWP